MTDGSRQASYVELDHDANRLANYLRQRGLQPGDKVSTICDNSIELVKAIFGIHRAGLVWVPINTMLRAEEMNFILQHAEVGFALIDDRLYAQDARRAVLTDRSIELLAIEIDGAPEAASLARFDDVLSKLPACDPDVEIGDRDLAMIMYTSGTTSRPKGAMHCHLAVVMAAMSNCIEFQLSRDDGISGQLPLFHCAGHSLLLSYLMVGGRMALMRGFDPVACMETIERNHLTSFIGLPMMYQAILDHPRRSEFMLSSLRFCLYAMAPMSRPLLERAITELCPRFRLTSGQTEMYPATAMSRPELQLERFGNYWGEPTIVNDVAIMSDDGALLPPGETGELVHRGPNVMLGYYNDPEATEAARAFGWHHTGDLALVDERGEILFIDRKKDIIKSGGENVSSIKIEETLLAHPAVESVGVVGLPHPQWGEAVSAFVKLKPGAIATTAEIDEHCRRYLAGFQIPKLVHLLDEVPLTATGKLQKAKLRHAFREYFK